MALRAAPSLHHRRTSLYLVLHEAGWTALATSATWVWTRWPGTTGIASVGDLAENWRGSPPTTTEAFAVGLAAACLPACPGTGRASLAQRTLRGLACAAAMQLIWHLPAWPLARWHASPWSGMACVTGVLMISLLLLRSPGLREMLRLRPAFKALAEQLSGWKVHRSLGWPTHSRALRSPRGQHLSLHVARGHEVKRGGISRAHWQGATEGNLSQRLWDGPQLLWIWLPRQRQERYPATRWSAGDGMTLPGSAAVAARQLEDMDCGPRVPSDASGSRAHRDRRTPKRSADDLMQVAGSQLARALGKRVRVRALNLSAGSCRLAAWPHPELPGEGHPDLARLQQATEKSCSEHAIKVIWLPLIDRPRLDQHLLEGGALARLHPEVALYTGQASGLKRVLGDEQAARELTLEGLGIRAAAAQHNSAKAPPAPMRVKTAHEILEIHEGASPEEIKAAWRSAAKRYHPDRVASLGEEFRLMAEEKMKAINKAYLELDQA